MGSGHILVYAFDVFMQLYEAEGQSPRTSSELILENNLFGLDIDQRAFQLAYFALMMKGRQYSRRILSKQLRPNVYVVPNNSDIGEAELQLVQMQFNDQKKAQQDLLTLAEGFKNGAELGSLIKFEGLDFENLKSGLNNTNIFFFDQSIKEMILVGELLQQQYEIGITNPPYMGSSGMDKILSGYVKKIYPDSKSDLFGVFIERLEDMIKSTGYYAMITQHAWMFLSSFEKLRIKINQQTIVNMAHLGTRAFEEIGGEVVQTTAFIMTPKKYKNYMGSYLRLVDFENYKLKETMTLDAVTDGPTDYSYEATQDNFLIIPGQPISYWVSEIIFSTFANIMPLGELEKAGTGLQTSNGNRFLRFWYEIDTGMINKKWYHLAKGGSYRKWYGNNEYVVNWENNGSEIKESIVTRYPYLRGNYSLVVKNEKKYFASGVITSRVTSGKLSFRFSPNDEIFSDATTGIFPIHNHLFYLGLLNSPILTLITELNPTLNFQAGDLEKLPLILPKTVVDFEKKVQILITISKIDWDSFEESWDFKKHPLI
ncbi:conserved protein of unknown function [Latilactobacillus sakei]|nr:conserved protein of unknown function [Latilactobacillus sakei]